MDVYFFIFLNNTDTIRYKNYKSRNNLENWKKYIYYFEVELISELDALCIVNNSVKMDARRRAFQFIEKSYSSIHEISNISNLIIFFKV